jgi:hypothetical protein
MLVGEKRAPFSGAASQLSAARPNTFHLPLVHPYPPRPKLIHTFCRPPPYKEIIQEYLVAKKLIGHAEREILVMV